MDFKLPKPLGNLVIIDIFEYIDGPKVFSCENENKQIFVINWIDTNPNYDTWFYVPVSKQRLGDIRRGKISLRDCILKSETGRLYQVITPSIGLGEVLITERTVEEIIEDELPDEDSFIENYPVEQENNMLLPIKEETRLSAIRAQRDVLDLSFASKGNHDHEVDAAVLGSSLLFAQELVNFLPQKKKQTGRYKLSKDDTQKYKLKAVGCYAASFGVRLESEAYSNLFGDTQLSETLEDLMKLLESTKNVTGFKKMIKEKNIKVVKIFYEFLSLLKDENVELTAEWASPKEKYMVTKLERESIELAISAINEEIQNKESEIVIKGQLVGVNVQSNKFNLITDEDEHIYGKISDQIGNTKYTVPIHVEATIKETIEANILTGTEKTTYLLLSIRTL